jgi:hypothetical protein
MGLQSDAKMERRNAHYSRRSLSTASIILQESLQSGREEEEACNSRKDPAVNWRRPLMQASISTSPDSIPLKRLRALNAGE